MSRKRKGMVIKNTNDRIVEVNLATRSLVIEPGEEYFITADEVKDPILREKLQIRAISIVRPMTDDEEDAVQRLLEEQEQEEEE